MTGPMRPKQMKIRTDPEADTTQGEKAESQSQPKRGVATTEQMDMIRKQTAMCFTFRASSCSRNGERVASRDPME